MNTEQKPLHETESMDGKSPSTAGLCIAQYAEDGERFLVDVLVDNSDDEAHAFDLRRRDTGEEFFVWWKRSGGYCGGMWRLCFGDGRIVP